MRHWHMNKFLLFFSCLLYDLHSAEESWSECNALNARLGPRCHSHTHTHTLERTSNGLTYKWFSVLFDFESTIEYLNPNDKWRLKQLICFTLIFMIAVLGDGTASRETPPTQSVEHICFTFEVKMIIIELNKFTATVWRIVLSYLSAVWRQRSLHAAWPRKLDTFAARRTIEFSPVAMTTAMTTEKNWFVFLKNAIPSILFVSEWRAISSSGVPKINGRHHDVH